MNRIPRAFTALALSALTVTALAASSPYTVSRDAQAQASFNFTVTLIPVPGTVKGVTAALSVNPDDLSRTTGTVTVDLRTLETGIALRDDHAKGFLGVINHPKAVFTLTGITGAPKLEAGKTVTATANGRFELNGISTPLRAPVTLRRSKQSIAVSTAFNVALADHRIEILGADPNVGVKVNFTLAPNP
jgi:polyisoprenoid-binding protein YceI